MNSGHRMELLNKSKWNNCYDSFMRPNFIVYSVLYYDQISGILQFNFYWIEVPKRLYGSNSICYLLALR